MNAADVLDVARDALMTILIVCAPVMLVALLVGLVVSLFQSLTQIQEATLTFIPKIIAMFASLLLFLPFMGAHVATFTQELMARIAAGG